MFALIYVKTRRVKLTQLYIVCIILNWWIFKTDYTYVFTDESKDGGKTAAAFICQSDEFSKRLPNKASICTAELEAMVFALRYIKITAKNNKFVVLLTQNLHCYFCCPVIWKFLETNVLILQRKLHYKMMFLNV